MVVWNQAVLQTKRDRRKDGEPLRRIWNVAIVCKARPDTLLRGYFRQCKRLADAPHFATRWALWRQIRGHVALKRMVVRRGAVHRDSAGHVVGREPSTIVFTQKGMRYVRKRATDVQFPERI